MAWSWCSQGRLTLHKLNVCNKWYNIFWRSLYWLCKSWFLHVSIYFSTIHRRHGTGNVFLNKMFYMLAKTNGSCEVKSRETLKYEGKVTLILLGTHNWAFCYIAGVWWMKNYPNVQVTSDSGSAGDNCILVAIQTSLRLSHCQVTIKQLIRVWVRFN